jgi:hypothetical protein
MTKQQRSQKKELYYEFFTVLKGVCLAGIYSSVLFYIPFLARMGMTSTVSVPEFFLSYFHVYSVMFLQQVCIFFIIKTTVSPIIILFLILSHATLCNT